MFCGAPAFEAHAAGRASTSPKRLTLTSEASTVMVREVRVVRSW